ncbi:MAG: Nramp family divalent metal transporter [Bacteroidota bacterium]
MKFSLLHIIKDLRRRDHKPALGGLDIFKFIGPGLLVTVGFIDPGNWASNLAAGSDYGYQLLWVVTLSTIMLIVLQHNVAHLGIATGLCLSEAATMHMPKWVSRSVLSSAIVASVSTSLAELLGGAIALQMLFSIPIRIGALITLITILILVFSNSYRKLEKWIIGFVSLIGLSFIYELVLTNISWSEAITGWINPTFPDGSMIVIMSVLGAVVMPHNLFLHSEIIQSRQWNLVDEKSKNRQLRYEFLDTLFSMIIGWAINSAMILMAAATFFRHKIPVHELQQAQNMLVPLLGSNAATIFAVALLMAGIASTVTSAMAGGSIFAGFFGEPFDMKDNHSRLGVLISLIPAVLVIFVISDPFKGLLYSQMLLSIQLPITIFTQIYLTSSRKVMNKYANSLALTIFLVLIGAAVTFFNIRLFASFF